MQQGSCVSVQFEHFNEYVFTTGSSIKPEGYDHHKKTRQSCHNQIH